MAGHPAGPHTAPGCWADRSRAGCLCPSSLLLTPPWGPLPTGSPHREVCPPLPQGDTLGPQIPMTRSCLSGAQNPPSLAARGRGICYTAFKMEGLLRKRNRKSPGEKGSPLLRKGNRILKSQTQAWFLSPWRPLAEGVQRLTPPTVPADVSAMLPGASHRALRGRSSAQSHAATASQPAESVWCQDERGSRTQARGRPGPCPCGDQATSRGSGGQAASQRSPAGAPTAAGLGRSESGQRRHGLLCGLLRLLTKGHSGEADKQSQLWERTQSSCGGKAPNPLPTSHTAVPRQPLPASPKARLCIYSHCLAWDMGCGLGTNCDP